MNLNNYPVPPVQTGLGIHGGANAFFPLGEDGPDWAIGQLKEMGFSWVKLLDVEGSSLACIRAIKAAGIEPIVRLYRPTPQPGTLDDAPKTKAAVPFLIGAGCVYYEVSNEDQVNWEQKSGTIPADAPEQSARGFMVDADYIIGLGGIPLITAMSPGGHMDDILYLRRMVWYLKDNWGLAKLDRCAIAVHNAALNHPLNFPFDDVNQKGIPVQDYGAHEWAGTEAEVNAWRTAGKNVGQKLLDPGASNGWLKYQAVHDLVWNETGLDLPVLSTEGGIWPGELQDNRYPKVSKQDVTDGYVQIAKDMAAGKYPDWYLNTGYWLMANRGMGNPDMSFEYQTWFNSNGVWIDAVQAYKDLPHVVRPPAILEPPLVPNVLSDNSICDILKAAGFAGDGLITGIAVVLAESGGNTNAINTTGNTPPSTDAGLWQINLFHHPDVTKIQALDPVFATNYAYTLSKQGTDFTPWSAFNAGTYKQFMNRAIVVAGPVKPSPDFAAFLKNLAWNNLFPTGGVPYTPDNAFPKYAKVNVLGLPFTKELDFTFDCVFYRGQLFHAIEWVFVYCILGDWGNIHEIVIE